MQNNIEKLQKSQLALTDVFNSCEFKGYLNMQKIVYAMTYLNEVIECMSTDETALNESVPITTDK